MKRILVLVVLACACGSFRTFAQATGCSNLIGCYYNSCCGQQVMVCPANPGGSYYIETGWGYCCGTPTMMTEVLDYCDEGMLINPALLEKFWKADPSGRMLVASCDGSLIPLPAAKQEQWTLRGKRLLSRAFYPAAERSPRM